jgi:hypothetical protein
MSLIAVTRRGIAELAAGKLDRREERALQAFAPVGELPAGLLDHPATDLVDESRLLCYQ